MTGKTVTITHDSIEHDVSDDVFKLRISDLRRRSKTFDLSMNNYLAKWKGKIALGDVISIAADGVGFEGTIENLEPSLPPQVYRLSGYDYAQLLQEKLTEHAAFVNKRGDEILKGTAGTPDAQGNYPDGLLYNTGISGVGVDAMDYTIKRFKVEYEPVWKAVERIMNIGDSAGLWDYYVDSNKILYTYPRSQTGTVHDFTAKTIRSRIPYNRSKLKNKIIVIGGKVKTANGVWQEIKAVVSAGAGDRQRVFFERDITDVDDAAQRATVLLAELNQIFYTGELQAPGNGFAINDLARIYNLHTDQTEDMGIVEIEHTLGTTGWKSRVNFGEERHGLGDPIMSAMVGLDDVKRYGDVCDPDDLAQRLKFQNSQQFNLSPDKDEFVHVNIPEEGVLKVYLAMKGVKFRTSTRTDLEHTHDPGNLKDTAQNHDYGNQQDQSQIHDYGNLQDQSQIHGSNFDAPNPPHDYGNLEDLSQTHDEGSYYSTIPSKNSNYEASHWHWVATYVGDAHGGLPERGMYNFEGTGATTRLLNIWSNITAGWRTKSPASDHRHSVPIGTEAVDGGSAGPSAADIDYGNTGTGPLSDVTGNTTPSAALLDYGNAGPSAAVLDYGYTGTDPAVIDSGNTGTKTDGVGIAEDTYPLNVHLWINGIDRTNELGGPWGDGSNPFDLSGVNRLELTPWCSADGEHELKFTSEQNGHIRAYVDVYY